MAFRTPEQAAEDQKKSAALALIFPELESCYGRYPMKHGNWMYPIVTETDEKGRPAFVPVSDDITKDDAEPKEHYVFGSADHDRLGKRRGYYHLLTKEAHIILNRRINKLKMKWEHPIGSETRQDRKLAQEIIGLRASSGMADDDHAIRSNTMVVAFQGSDNQAKAGAAVMMKTALMTVAMPH